MNAINYRKKQLIRIGYSSKEDHENFDYPEYVLCL